MTTAKESLITELKALGKEVIAGKGGFFIRGEGFLTTRQAQKLTGIKPKPRTKRLYVSPYGDWATIQMITRVKLDKSK